MSGGKGGGLLNRLVISPLIGLTLFFTGCYFVLGPSTTASFATTTTSALGYAAGVTVGSLPNLFENMKEGQGDVGGSQPAAPKKAAPKAGGNGGNTSGQADGGSTD
jgi:hypothetical protein